MMDWTVLGLHQFFFLHFTFLQDMIILYLKRENCFGICTVFRYFYIIIQNFYKKQNRLYQNKMRKSSCVWKIIMKSKLIKYALLEIVQNLPNQSEQIKNT